MDYYSCLQFFAFILSSNIFGANHCCISSFFSGAIRTNVFLTHLPNPDSTVSKTCCTRFLVPFFLLDIILIPTVLLLCGLNTTRKYPEFTNASSTSPFQLVLHWLSGALLQIDKKLPILSRSGRHAGSLPISYHNPFIGFRFRTVYSCLPSERSKEEVSHISQISSVSWTSNGHFLWSLLSIHSHSFFVTSITSAISIIAEAHNMYMLLCRHFIPSWFF